RGRLPRGEFRARLRDFARLLVVTGIAATISVGSHLSATAADDSSDPPSVAESVPSGGQAARDEKTAEEKSAADEAKTEKSNLLHGKAEVTSINKDRN